MNHKWIVAGFAFVVLVFSCDSVDNTLPAADAVYPRDHSILNEGDTTLRFSTPVEAQRYQVQLGENEEFSGKLLVDAEVQTPEIAVPGYRYNEVYFWRVRYRSEGGKWSSWSGPWIFGTFVDSPFPKTPTRDDYLHDRRPLFSWSPIKEAVGYDLQISLSEDAEPTYTAEEIPGTDHELTRDLDTGSSYTWRVRGRFARGVVGTWSKASNFTIINAWKRSYGPYEEGRDYRAYAAASYGEGYVIAGDIRIWNGSDIAVSVLSSEGLVESSHAYGLRPRDDIADIDVLNDKLIIAVTTSDVEREDRNVWCLVTDPRGEPIWQTFVRARDDQVARDTAHDSSESVYVTGYITSPDEKSDTRDGFLLKYSPTGIVDWFKRYSGEKDDLFTAMAIDSDRIILAGSTDSFDSEGSAVLIVALDFDGEVLWARQYDANLDEESGGPDCLHIGSDSTIHIAGSSSRSNRVGGSMITFTVDADGDILSAFELSGEGRSFATSIETAENGDLIIGGSVLADSPVAGGLIRTPKVIRIDAAGHVIWQRGTAGAYPQTVESLLRRDDGCIIAVGWWYEFNLDSAWAMQIDSQGQYPADASSITLETIPTTLEERDVEFSIRDIEYTPWSSTSERRDAGIDTRLLWP